ncbi:MAG: hypothetical protein JXR97_15025 [Planctomycetes bacterium]|nr:hypothetical protein [Planctomycetota bacterium]
MSIFNELLDWCFDIDEVSAGVYQVVAKDSKGHLIEMTGVNPDKLLNDCKEKAIAVQDSGK